MRRQCALSVRLAIAFSQNRPYQSNEPVIALYSAGFIAIWDQRFNIRVDAALANSRGPP
jgi:hypothetical protein